jgi:hypothetical protein
VGGCKRGVAPQASASASYQDGLSRFRWVGHGVLLLMNLISAQSSICIVCKGSVALGAQRPVTNCGHGKAIDTRPLFRMTVA